MRLTIADSRSELGSNNGSRFLRHAGRIYLEHAVRMVDGRAGATWVKPAVGSDRCLTDDPACMDKMKINPAMKVSDGHDLVDGTQSRIKEVNHVRTEVP